jgi:CRP-like cAMP-binding protein
MLEDLSKVSIDELAAGIELKTFHANETIYKKKEFGEDFYIIVKG